MAVPRFARQLFVAFLALFLVFGSFTGAGLLTRAAAQSPRT